LLLAEFCFFSTSFLFLAASTRILEDLAVFRSFSQREPKN
jgi:hypothetical protein